MKTRATETDFDRELTNFPPDLRWREWMRRVEAVLFASAASVARGVDKTWGSCGAFSVCDGQPAI